MITQDVDSIRRASAEHGGSVRWIAPEILDGQGTYSKEADVFSFAGVAIEVRYKCSTARVRRVTSYCSSHQRLSPVLPRLAIDHFMRPSWQSQLESVHHDRPIRLWLTVYGRWCNDVGMKKPTYALTRCAFYLTCRFPLGLHIYWLTFPPHTVTALRRGSVLLIVPSLQMSASP
jgi:hypothetical protein